MDNISVKVWIEHVKKNINALEASINLADKNRYIVKNHLEELGITVTPAQIDKFTEVIRQTIRYIRLSEE